MGYWKFKVFCPKDNKDEIREWINSHGPKPKAKIDYKIRRLGVTPMGTWSRPDFDIMHGHDKIHEIRAEFSGTQYRLFGCFGPGRAEFTILIGAIEKDGYDPGNALEIAEQRCKLINEEGNIDDY